MFGCQKPDTECPAGYGLYGRVIGRIIGKKKVNKNEGQHGCQNDGAEISCNALKNVSESFFPKHNIQ